MELHRLRREELRRSLESPHPESAEVESEGFEEWTRSLPEEDTPELVNISAGQPVRWIPGEGWLKERE